MAKQKKPRSTLTFTATYGNDIEAALDVVRYILYDCEVVDGILREKQQRSAIASLPLPSLAEHPAVTSPTASIESAAAAAASEQPQRQDQLQLKRLLLVRRRLWKECLPVPLELEEKIIAVQRSLE